MDRVSEKIIKDAKKEHDRIIKSAEEERKEKSEERKEEIKRITKQIEKEAKEREESEYERLVGLEEIRIRNNLLQYKHHLMNNFLREVEENIISFDGYKNLITSLIEKAVETGKEEISAGKNERVIDQKFIEKLNKEKGWQLKLCKDRVPIKGGFILSRENLRVDASVETILKQKIETQKPELVKILFG